MIEAVRLTSFKRHFEESPDRHAASIAVYQPKWFPELPKCDGFDIRENGLWTRPRDFMPEDHDRSEPDDELLRRYHDRLLGLYAQRADAIHTWFATHYGEWDLCCWCPYDKAAKRQLDQFGSFVCHSWPVETFLKVYGIPVTRDGDRASMVAT